MYHQLVSRHLANNAITLCEPLDKHVCAVSNIGCLSLDRARFTEMEFTCQTQFYSLGTKTSVGWLQRNNARGRGTKDRQLNF